jgi:hypothetical protein
MKKTYLLNTGFTSTCFFKKGDSAETAFHRYRSRGRPRGGGEAEGETPWSVNN